MKRRFNHNQNVISVPSERISMKKTIPMKKVIILTYLISLWLLVNCRCREDIPILVQGPRYSLDGRPNIISHYHGNYTCNHYTEVVNNFFVLTEIGNHHEGVFPIYVCIFAWFIIPFVFWVIAFKHWFFFPRNKI